LQEARLLYLQFVLTGAGSNQVETVAQFLPRLEGGYDFLGHVHHSSRSRVAAYAASPNLNRECAKASQLYSVSTSHRRLDLVEDGVDGLLNVAGEKVRTVSRNSLHKF